jgi:pimeloyl-ACP methyl ester carboxylesterase
MTIRWALPPHSGARRRPALLCGALSIALLVGCSGATAEQAARAADLYQVEGETAHLQCQGSGTPTVVLLGGADFTTTTWSRLRSQIGLDVRTCAWDYPGGGHSTGKPMMTAARAASSLHGTLEAAGVELPVVLVGHSVAGLPARLFVGQHPAEVAGVVLLDPTVPSFARRFDNKGFRPRWDGARSADRPRRSRVGRTSPSRSSGTTRPSTQPARFGAMQSKRSGPPTRPPSRHTRPEGARTSSRGRGTTSTSMHRLRPPKPCGGYSEPPHVACEQSVDAETTKESSMDQPAPPRRVIPRCLRTRTTA